MWSSPLFPLTCIFLDELKQVELPVAASIDSRDIADVRSVAPGDLGRGNVSTLMEDGSWHCFPVERCPVLEAHVGLPMGSQGAGYAGHHCLL